MALVSALDVAPTPTAQPATCATRRPRLASQADLSAAGLLQTVPTLSAVARNTRSAYRRMQFLAARIQTAQAAQIATRGNMCARPRLQLPVHRLLRAQLGRFAIPSTRSAWPDPLAALVLPNVHQVRRAASTVSVSAPGASSTTTALPEILATRQQRHVKAMALSGALPAQSVLLRITATPICASVSPGNPSYAVQTPNAQVARLALGVPARPQRLARVLRMPIALPDRPAPKHMATFALLDLWTARLTLTAHLARVAEQMVCAKQLLAVGSTPTAVLVTSVIPKPTRVPLVELPPARTTASVVLASSVCSPGTLALLLVLLPAHQTATALLLALPATPSSASARALQPDSAALHPIAPALRCATRSLPYASPQLRAVVAVIGTALSPRPATPTDSCALRRRASVRGTQTVAQLSPATCKPTPVRRTVMQTLPAQLANNVSQVDARRSLDIAIMPLHAPPLARTVCPTSAYPTPIAMIIHHALEARLAPRTPARWESPVTLTPHALFRARLAAR
jgi:hypothetical protein